MTELKPHQPPMTVDEQVANLKEVGLIIENEEYARAFLNDVSYFRLIKAYSLGLKVKNGRYHDNVRFEDIVNLYLFNANFRQLLFPEIEKVEINLRCRLSNYFCCKYGVLGYENTSNFVMPAKSSKAFMDSIKREILRNSRSPFVRNYRDKYEEGKIPLYALVELMSFGTLSKFYKNMKNEDKKAVAVQFGVSYKYFQSWIESLAYVRNICAHYGRLYNNKLVKTPKLFKQCGFDNRYIFATLITLKHLLPNDRQWKGFVQAIESLIKKYPNINMDLIGFPNDWLEWLQ